MVVYIDVEILWAGLNFLFDYLILWATATAARLPVSPRRLAAGAATGTLYYALVVLAGWRLIPWYGIWHSPLVVGVWPLAMLAAAFAPTPAFWRAARLFYLLSVVAAGSGYTVAQLAGGAAGAVAALVCLLLLAELGWGVLRQQFGQKGLYIPLDIVCPDGVARITALYDTGNHLRDPLSAHPVVVVERDALAHVLPPPLRAAPDEVAQGKFAELTAALAAAGCAPRFHIIPFTSVGAANGLMAGFRPAQVTLWLNGRPTPAGDLVVGLCRHQLDPAGQYQALVGPEIIEAGRCNTGRVRHPIYEKGEGAYVASHN